VAAAVDCTAAPVVLADLVRTQSCCLQDCRTNNCLSVCQRSCKPAGVNIETCKRIGREVGEQTARLLAALQCGWVSRAAVQHLSCVQGM
jgi:hypothetical protein